MYEFTMRLKEERHFLWRYVYKINKLLAGGLYPVLQKRKTGRGTDPESEIIVSLTSYPARIGKVWVTAASLLDQTVKPKRVVLWLAREQFPDGKQGLPANLTRLEERGLDIRFCEEDLRSHKKYYYAFREFPDQYILTADDDIIYPPRHIEKLWDKQQEFPGCICCHYGHVITFKEDGSIAPYEDWRGGVDGYTKPSLRLMPVGCNGVLYPPHSMPEELFNKENIRKYCLSADDIWLKAMGVLNGVGAVTCNQGALVYFGVPGAGKTGLYRENTSGQRNNEAIRNVFSNYPEAQRILYRAYREKDEETQYRVLLVHPGKQHSLRLAEALEKEGMLFRYITTMYDKKGSLTHFLTRFLKGGSRKKAQGRKSAALPDERVKLCCESLGLAGRLLSRLIPSPVAYNRWNDYMNRRFGEKTARFAVRNELDAVISYDNDSDRLFEILALKAPKVKRILDVSIANRLYLKEVYEKDLERFGDTGLGREQFNLWEEKTVERLEKELRYSQYFLAASQVVRRSLLYSGVKESSVYHVPYGVDLEQFTFHRKERPHRPLRLLYVGNAGYRKGCHHLFQAVQELGSGTARLSVAGGYEPALYEAYRACPNIDFLGFVTRDRLAAQFEQADVFVLASLGEGMAMAGIEALACGLPMICTDMTGVNDVIEDGKNGFVIPAGEEEAIKEAVLWFVKHPDRLAPMSDAAGKTAAEYTWENYSRRAVKAVREICAEERMKKV